MFPKDIIALAEDVLAEARKRGLKIATAESCTGGLVAGALTAIAGSSDVFERGFVTYSNTAKEEMLGVESDALGRHGAVSAETAAAMALGAVERSFADVAVSITGIAGPGGGSQAKPVGLVHFGVGARRNGRAVVASAKEARYGAVGRDRIREESVRQALRLLLAQVRAASPQP